jgi:hypothetical protein
MAKKVLVLFLISSFFVTETDFSVNPVIGEGLPIQTNISAWVGSYSYLENDTIEIEVSIWDENGQAVETGTIAVNDLNSTSGGLFSVSGQVTNVSFGAITNGIVGVHIFELNYDDPAGNYLPVTKTLDIVIGRSISSGETTMILEMDYPAYSAVKGQEISITGNLTSGRSTFPYFYIDPEAAYMSIEANIEGDWKVIDTVYLTLGIVTVYNFDLSAVFPYWLETGVINARCIFSGTSDSDLDNVETYFTLNVLSSEKSLITFLQNDTVERNNITENHNIVMDVQVPGFDSEPVEIDVDLLTTGDILVKKLVDGQIITDYASQLTIGFSNDIPVGSYTLSSKLIDSNTDIILASDNHTVNLTDDLLIDNFFWDVNNQIVSPGQLIQGHLVSREEDTFIGIQSDLQVQIQGDILFYGTSDISGYIDFMATIPGSYTSGYYDISFTLVKPASSYYVSVTETFQVVIPESTSISHQENTNLLRNGLGSFNATVIDELSIPVGSGSLSLTLDGTLLHESTGGTSSYVYPVPQDATRGINIFTWTYTGDGYYNDSSQDIPVAIFSKPSFIDLSSSISELVPGGSLDLRGKLIEETGNPVIGETIHVTEQDNWGIENEYTLLTDGDGWFTINFSPDVDDVGTFFFSVEYQGNPSDYYLPVDGMVIFEVSVNPLISLQVNGPLIAGEISTLEFQGNPDQGVNLEIFIDDSWTTLASITLDSEGNHQYEWIPDVSLKGDVLLRTTYTSGQGESIFTVTINVRPQLSLEIIDSSFFTGEEITIQVTSSEIHNIWLDGQLWQSNLTSGSRQFTTTFSIPGDHNIVVTASGDNIIETTVSEAIQIREYYTVTVNFPERAQKGVTFHVEFTIENSQDPLEGFTVELFFNNTLVGTTITSQYGTASIDTSLIIGEHPIKVVITPFNSNIHLSKELKLGNITVYSLPSIKIQDIVPIEDESIDIDILTLDGINPVVDETINLYLENIDGSNRYLIGSNITNSEGITTITWNVTEESGDYYLKAENTGNQFLESIITSKMVHVLDAGPKIMLASITETNRDQNIFSITALVEFPSGSGNVYLCSSEKEQLGELQAEETIWITNIQLEKGIHSFWLKAIDNQGVEAWYDLGSVNAVNDLTTEPETGGSGSTGKNKMQDAIRDTLISVILTTPVAGVVVYRRRNARKQEVK